MMTVAARSGAKVLVINMMGRIFMDALDDPFARIGSELAACPLGEGCEAAIIDFHAEATSEKQALAFYLDGRVSAVIGTHTHVPTADERVLPGGTALLTDVGMTGPYESIIGMRADKVLRRFLLQTRAPFEVAKRDVRLSGALVDVDETTGRASRIVRIREDLGE